MSCNILQFFKTTTLDKFPKKTIANQSKRETTTMITKSHLVWVSVNQLINLLPKNCKNILSRLHSETQFPCFWEGHCTSSNFRLVICICFMDSFLTKSEPNWCRCPNSYCFQNPQRTADFDPVAARPNTQCYSLPLFSLVAKVSSPTPFSWNPPTLTFVHSSTDSSSHLQFVHPRYRAWPHFILQKLQKSKCRQKFWTFSEIYIEE